MDHPWYRDAIVYALDVSSFADSDGDGVGDLGGAASRLDHLADLGVTCVWLLPFFPSGGRDNGYDVVDHRGVDPRFGTVDDVRDFVRAARERGIRVIVDLVANHTSDCHHWFQAGRRDPDSPYRDYYVWRFEPPPENDAAEVMFPGVEDSIWERDDEVGGWYLHRFYRHEPDLDTASPYVVAEHRATLRFWLDAGVSGFRLDALPYIVRKAEPDGYRVIREWRALLDAVAPDAAFVSETDVDPDRYIAYFAAGCHAQLAFYLNNHVFLALARSRAEPVLRALRELPRPPEGCQWVNWLRNLDELDLEQLTPEERQEVFDAFAPDPDMRIYGRGIRRRLPPMLDGDVRRTAMAYALVAGLPGAFLLSYGEEIGLGDDLSCPERESVRVPMQWDDSPNGGFSTAPPTRLPRAVVGDGPFAYQKVNVAAQAGDPASLLARVRAILRARRYCTAIGSAGWSVVDAPPTVVGIRYDGVVTLANLGTRPARVLVPGAHGPDLLADRPYAEPSGAEVEIDGHGYRWVRV